MRHKSLGPLIAMLVAAVCPSPTSAENIDPDDDGSQFAYGENVGWINAEPSADGGPGVEVGDSALTGWMWGEDVGWISLSCSESGDCDTEPYGVTNDGDGNLGGFAWGENVGWINFSCHNRETCDTADYGVKIDPDTGIFSGRAWGENVGWITFDDTGELGFAVRTSWRGCVDAVPPGPVPRLQVDYLHLRWDAVPFARGYDVVRGNLADLSTGQLEVECVVDDHPDTEFSAPSFPAGGQAFFFLVRADGCAGPGTWDSPARTEIDTRDISIPDGPPSCSCLACAL